MNIVLAELFLDQSSSKLRAGLSHATSAIDTNGMANQRARAAAAIELNKCIWIFWS